jgi:hypothetical protein
LMAGRQAVVALREAAHAAMRTAEARTSGEGMVGESSSEEEEEMVSSEEEDSSSEEELEM